MRVLWVVYDTLVRIVSVKNLIFSLSVLLLLIILPLAMSDYWGPSPAWRDLYQEAINRSFVGYTYFFSQMLLTVYCIVIVAITAAELFSGEAEQIYLTGGISKLMYFCGRLFGLVAYIVMLWWTLLVLVGGTMLFTELGSLDWNMIWIFARLCLDSIVLSVVVVFLVGLAKTLIAGLVPIMAFQYWLNVNSNINAETAGSTVHALVNYVLPLNTFAELGGPEIEYLDLFMRYQSLAPWHGSMYLGGYTVFFLLGALLLYCRAEL